MTLPSITVIWCDVSFEDENSYRPMKDEFNETTTGTPKIELDSIDMAIFNEGKEQLRSNNVRLITIRTIDEAMHQIEKHKKSKIFVICSGTIGRHLVPEIVSRYHEVHYFYIYAHNIALHLDWADDYPHILKMFNFHTNLLLRLTRDISAYFIELGKTYLEVGTPLDALACFNHARDLELEANVRDKGRSDSNTMDTHHSYVEFRDQLDLLEGDCGLIAKAKHAARIQEYSIEDF